MVRREATLRLLPFNQKAMAEAEQSGTQDWMRVVERIQLQVCREFGMPVNTCKTNTTVTTNEWLTFLRSAASKYANDPEFQLAAHWIRYNRARPCPVALGDVVPPIHVVSLADEAEEKHKTILLYSGPLLVLAGSTT